MLHIQRIVTTWDKKARGGKAATIRNSYPEVLPVNIRDRTVQGNYDEINHIHFSHHFEVLNPKPEFPFYFEPHYLYCINHINKLDIYWNQSHATHTKRLVALSPESWFKIKYIRRHIDEYGWHWEKVVLNIHFGETEKLQSNYFQATKPVAVFEKHLYY